MDEKTAKFIGEYNALVGNARIIQNELEEN